MQLGATRASKGAPTLLASTSATVAWATFCGETTGLAVVRMYTACVHLAVVLLPLCRASSSCILVFFVYI